MIFQGHTASEGQSQIYSQILTKSGALGSPQRVVWGEVLYGCGMPSVWDLGSVEQYRCRWGARQWPTRPRFLGPGGEYYEGSLCRSRARSELLLCSGPAAPREAHVCPGCSERAWAGSLPRGLALARHSCRLDTMILTQIPHT